MMVRVQHEDVTKPFTLTSYKINNTPITLTQGETGDYSAFLTGPNVPDPTSGYVVEIVLELDGVEYTYTLNVSYIDDISRLGRVKLSNQDTFQSVINMSGSSSLTGRADYEDFESPFGLYIPLSDDTEYKLTGVTFNGTALDMTGAYDEDAGNYKFEGLTGSDGDTFVAVITSALQDGTQSVTHTLTWRPLA